MQNVIRTKSPKKKYDLPDRITMGGVFGSFADKEIVNEICGQQYRFTVGERECYTTVQDALKHLNKFRNLSPYSDALWGVLREARKEYEARAAKTKKNVKNKGEKEMNYKNFYGYIEEMRDVFNVSRATYTQLQDEYSRAKEAWKVACADYGMSESGRLIEKAHFLDAEEHYNNGMAQLQKDTKKRQQEARDALQKHLNEFYSVAPDKLDTKTMELLKAGILTGRELEALANSNRGNPTMLRVIASYAEKMPESGEAKMLRYKINNMGSGEHELKVFDDLNVWTEKALQATRQTADVFAGRWEEAYKGAVSRLGEMYAAPQSEE